MYAYNSVCESSFIAFNSSIYLLNVPDCLDNQFREENIVKESVSYFVQRRNRILRCRIGVAAHQLLMKIH